MKNLEAFTAVDFETATGSPASICQVGLVRVENGSIIQKVEQLIRPPKNEYYYKNIEIHGIQPENTIDSPTFDHFWPTIQPLIEDQVFVAHNVNFDANCLRSTLSHYGIAQPYFEERCTRAIYRRGLHYLSKKYKIPLQHHNALSDANACASLYIKYLNRMALPKTGHLF